MEIDFCRSIGPLVGLGGIAFSVRCRSRFGPTSFAHLTVSEVDSRSGFLPMQAPAIMAMTVAQLGPKQAVLMLVPLQKDLRSLEYHIIYPTRGAAFPSQPFSSIIANHC